MPVMLETGVVGAVEGFQAVTCGDEDVCHSRQGLWIWVQGAGRWGRGLAPGGGGIQPGPHGADKFGRVALQDGLPVHLIILQEHAHKHWGSHCQQPGTKYLAKQRCFENLV